MMKSTQINCVFQRVEKKYLLDEIKYSLLLKRIKPYMSCDQYGLSTICNIYFDTDTYDIIRHSIEKPEYKKKLNSTVYKKRKRQHICALYKDSALRLDLLMHKLYNLSQR
jgi:hypothetical protein